MWRVNDVNRIRIVNIGEFAIITSKYTSVGFAVMSSQHSKRHARNERIETRKKRKQ